MLALLSFQTSEAAKNSVALFSICSETLFFKATFFLREQENNVRSNLRILYLLLGVDCTY